MIINPVRSPAYLTFIFAIGSYYSVLAPAQTFSPYTPAQLHELNSQPIAPAETPMGPIYLGVMPANPNPKPSLDSRYVHNPEGEEQAEAQGEESAAPFEPIPATLTY
ncbi:hypothetical protein [Polynucleobacter sp. AP-Nino-20-G2]|uniref:hypothetical protein n=1 Tax=Polynucleobacter sp. AP-Nino-20-G2 TaxID=2576917 RepID=UPI001BFD368B|nr:hypothetical protein [Polynucleobacter sp. AP-Nino-20-G2]QWE17022.1 hypothetical protein FD960_01995 [Polynucleobacter sp. AP-Nino-20-G2]